ncbi:glycerol-3-phosphate dehydrogenase (NAD+) [Pancytospora epiphaga]|nr:glycerol-3-phosphate dehydrogenase (NAD+) [Pancytospora epiphaga]
MKIAVIGGGNWGTAIAKLIGENVLRESDFNNEVILWIYEEVYNEINLSEQISMSHENPKYLPGVKLPKNLIIRTEYDLSDADILVFCMPHQFLDILKNFKIKKGVFGINLGKGMIDTGHELLAPSEYIASMLGIDCSCLMGANIATEVAEEKFSDSTLGAVNQNHSELFKRLFQSAYFKVEAVPYDKSIEICSALKNVVSIAVGICDGMEWGKNTYALIFRQGLKEMKRFCGVMKGTLEICSSACVGDLLVSCLCGRNYKCGVALGKERITVKSYEKSMNGQMLQGPGTALTVVSWLKNQKYDEKEFPVIFMVNDICQGISEPSSLLSMLKQHL